MGASGGCKFQDKIEEILPHLAQPEGTESARAEAKKWIEENDKKIQCSKIRMDPSACFECRENPQGRTRKAIDREALGLHSDNIRKIERLHDMVRMNLIRLCEIRDLEFEMLRLYWWQIERVMNQSQVRLF